MTLAQFATHPPLILAGSFALIYGAIFATRDVSWPKTLIKTSAVAVLAGTGASLGAPFWVVVALGLGALGDFCLSRPGERAFLAGMAAFGLGHLAYAVWAFHPGGLQRVWWLALPVVLLALSTEVWLAPRLGALRMPVRGYVVLITLMALAVLTQSVALITAGAICFLVSDALLALDLFVLKRPWPHRPALQRLLWGAYWGGQALILAGSLGQSVTT